MDYSKRFQLVSLQTLLLVACFLCVDSQSPAPRFDLYQTIGGDESVRFRQEAPIDAQAEPLPSYARIIRVNPSIEYQGIKGFGAAMSNSAAYLLNNQTEVLESLFNRETGAGLSYMRLPMGATDFQPNPPYTYNDLENNWDTDYELEFFSIEKDKEYIIPALKQMLAINPHVKIMGSPWSPPAWMKTSHSLNWGQLYWDFPNMNALANYFVKFIKAYEEEGIFIEAITVQNEPHHESGGYPTMFMSAEQQTDFIANYIGPAFEANGISSIIVAWDHNWDVWEYPIQVLNDPVAKSYTAGTAFHCYLGNYWDTIRVVEVHPDRDIYFTECSGGEWSTAFDWNLFWYSRDLFFSQLLQYTRNVLLWNLALDEHHGPTHPDASGCRDCRGVVTKNDDGTWVKEVEYYLLMHFSKYLQEGAVRVETSFVYPDGSEDIPFNNADEAYAVAFKNPDGTIVVVVSNGWAAGPASFSIEVENDDGPSQYYNYENLWYGTLATFVQQVQ